MDDNIERKNTDLTTLNEYFKLCIAFSSVIECFSPVVEVGRGCAFRHGPAQGFEYSLPLCENS